MRTLFICIALVLLAGCTTLRPVTRTPKPWDARLAELQALQTWHAQGRAAVAVDTQGWQAALGWQQRGSMAEVHLSGPFGIGAMVIRQSPDGSLSLNDGVSGAAVLAQLRDKLGFDLPVDELRYWLLGVPVAGAPFDLRRNTQDRAQHLSQSDWSVDYDRYTPVGSDVLPALVVLNRAQVRVRIIIEQWSMER